MKLYVLNPGGGGNGSGTLTGGGTVATGGYTLTVPATGTAALLGVANTFTAAQTITGGTVTASTPLLVSTQTWNNAGVAFVGQDFSFTRSAAATGSIMARWSTAGRGSFSLDESGELLIGSSAGAAFRTGNAPAISGPSGSTLHLGCHNGGCYLGNTNVFGADVLVSGAGSKMAMRSALVFGWSSDTTSYGTLDLSLLRDAAATLQMGQDHATAPTLQTLKAHDVTTGTGAALTLAGGKGSVAGGAVILATSVTNGAPVDRVTVGADGSVIFNTLPSTAPALGTNGQVTIELTNNTTLTFKARGSDGTTRSGTVTLA